MIEFKNNLYITKKELEKVIQILPNAQDKFFMMCLFYGLGSKKFSILGNLKKTQIDLIKKEIVLEDKKEAIFHSKAPWLLKILKNENIFEDEMKTSIIDHYINERYY